MKHLNGHETLVHSITRTPQGVTFAVRCCECLKECTCEKDENGTPTHFEKSVHIGGAHKFSGDLTALDRVMMAHEREASNDHEAAIVVEEFLKKRAAKAAEDCGCN